MNDNPPRRHALGMPGGSVRAILTLMVVALVCALLLLPTGERPRPIPLYLLYLLFLCVGHYFAARGHARDPNQPAPLFLPTGCVRLIILIALGGTIVLKYINDRPGLEAHLQASLESVAHQYLLPVIILAGFFVGVIVRMIVGRYERSLFFLNLEAWIALMALLLMFIAVLIHLVINPTLSDDLRLPEWEGFLAAVVAFYFGERS